jgi:hypothetical protein
VRFSNLRRGCAGVAREAVRRREGVTVDLGQVAALLERELGRDHARWIAQATEGATLKCAAGRQGRKRNFELVSGREQQSFPPRS